MNRRDFLWASPLALALLTSPSLRAEILKGRDATMHGQRDRTVWLRASRLSGARLARPGDQLQVIAFIDLNCPACADLWQWFDTPERRNWATLWVPVVYMKKSSSGRAVALLRAADPHAALAVNYRNFDYKNRVGGLVEAGNPTMQEESDIRRNTRYWNGALFGTTPLILYRNKDSTYWQLLGNLPEPEMSRYFADLAPARLAAY